jgi:phage shock protein C
MTDTPYQQPPNAGQPYPGASQPPPYRQLRRREDDRMVAGVCAGLADYLRVDPTLIRVGFALLAVLTWGVALVAYVIAWAVMPPATAGAPAAAPPVAGSPPADSPGAGPPAG